MGVRILNEAVRGDQVSDTPIGYLIEPAVTPTVMRDMLYSSA